MEMRLLGKTSDSGYTFNRLTGGGWLGYPSA